MLSSGVLPKKGGLYSGARQWGSKLEQLDCSRQGRKFWGGKKRHWDKEDN